MRFVEGYTGQVSTLLGSGGEEGGKERTRTGAGEGIPVRVVLGARL